MPVKNHRPGLVRTHSRSSSGGSRAALNLQITQKDSIQPKTEKGAKRPGHAYETGTRSASRTGSALRVQSKEHVANLPPRRAPTPHANRPGAGGGKQKPGFTLASPGSDDEDEWISSESGAATPNRPDEGSDESES
ncbi:hypothetical protein EVG20_g10146 [Dentipellis fragilis]|uniref:Uncharacterized protein n=1 Tax=Dentipellis fragilis TaxID=205917 RepID=A0A4Y9XVC4_9AGAM|nr:hypothetical protein EVG20_g10146 [Dentipellis fragilis]